MLAVLMGEEDPRNSASRLYRQISLALMENSMLAFGLPWNYYNIRKGTFFIIFVSTGVVSKVNKRLLYKTANPWISNQVFWDIERTPEKIA